MSGKNSSIDRLSDLAQQWFLSEPLLFSAWTTHKLVANSKIATIRTGRGLVEVNPDFVDSLDLPTLREVMKFEAIRIVLKHPYERRKTNAELAYEASNLAIQECMQMALPMPRASERFGSDEHDLKHYEYYYQLLVTTMEHDDANEASDGNDERCENNGESECEAEGQSPRPCNGTSNAPRSGIESKELPEYPGAQSDITSYCEKNLVAIENASHWNDDTFFCERINEIISDIEASQNWGSTPGKAREAIVASLIPKLDYRRVLTAFRATILSSRRRLTRMKPSRRYGFAYMGSRREFSTKLLFAVDVSGSVATVDVQAAFSIVNRLFKYGIESIDVIWFDTQIRSDKPIRLSRALAEFKVEGRGGTNFQAVMDYLDDQRQYDGLIVFTDGIAPVPTPPQRNRHTRVVWLFNHEENWKSRHVGLENPRMLTAFVRAD